MRTSELLQLAERSRLRAEAVLAASDICNIWRSVGAEPHLVGSLRTGLLMTHRDIDIHIYSAPFTLQDSFTAMARLTANPAITRLECVNLLHTEECCVEWHAWQRDSDGELWQIDMIHMPKGSPYDGYFESVADAIRAALTPETRTAILRLKYETPAEEKIMGIEYYQAVLEGGVRTLAEFRRWRAAHPVTGINLWKPEPPLPKPADGSAAG